MFSLKNGLACLGINLGLDPKLLADILGSATGRCWSVDTYNPCTGVLPNVPSSNDYKVDTKYFDYQKNALFITKIELLKHRGLLRPNYTTKSIKQVIIDILLINDPLIRLFKPLFPSSNCSTN